MSQWVKTSDRMPDELQDVIGYWQGLMDMTLYRIIQGETHWWSEHKRRYVQLPPSHWHPLPQPPEDQS
jgi:hypothetical protein